MARIERYSIPGVPHHVTQRGNRRQETFFSEDDYLAYLSLIGEFSRKKGVEIWAYCLMPNHVHLILVPSDEDGLRGTLGEAHRRYTRRINFRENWRGHLWQERFHSFPMDEAYLLACARYVELNPVRAGLVARAEDWRWSSARAHLSGQGDGVVKIEPLLERMPDWSSFLACGQQDEHIDALRRHSHTGHPLGSGAFYQRLQVILGKDVQPRKPGRPKRTDE